MCALPLEATVAIAQGLEASRSSCAVAAIRLVATRWFDRSIAIDDPAATRRLALEVLPLVYVSRARANTRRRRVWQGAEVHLLRADGTLAASQYRSPGNRRSRGGCSGSFSIRSGRYRSRAWSAVSAVSRRRWPRRPSSPFAAGARHRGRVRSDGPCLTAASS